MLNACKLKLEVYLRTIHRWSNIWELNFTNFSNLIPNWSLLWVRHTAQLVKSSSLSAKTKLFLCKTLLRPIIYYGAPTWIICSNPAMTRCEAVENWIRRYCIGLPYNWKARYGNSTNRVINSHWLYFSGPAKLLVIT